MKDIRLYGFIPMKKSCCVNCGVYDSGHTWLCNVNCKAEDDSVWSWQNHKMDDYFIQKSNIWRRYPR